MLARGLLVSLLGVALVAATGQPCGFRIAPCPQGEICLPNDPNCSRGENCAGTCVAAPTYKFCGGFAGFQCEGDNETCYDDPRDDCDPNNGGADCGGICLAPDNIISCGGITGKQCPTGLTCYDFPEDDCNPEKGGADCIGFCL
jgi:hypothetical protein